MTTPTNTPEPRAIPRGWIPPEPWRLRSIFDRALPQGHITLLEHPKRSGGCPVVFKEGIELDPNWQTWISPTAKKNDNQLPLDYDGAHAD